MATKRCTNGHYFDPSKHTSCPLCSKVGASIPRTEMAPAAGVAIPVPGVSRLGEETKAVYQKSGTVDPVVGWLVCVKGPSQGRDYRLHSEKNFIGRSTSMDICIAEDESVSREKHAVVSFNPKKRVFKVHPGESRGLVYLNGEEVEAPVELKRKDQIELGETSLMFFPLCSKDFQWEKFLESE
ncbi:MAG: FHA domain-containing protein [Bdellovibrionales bacterium]|nr:FHA domain-containing protein [Bdellovibrionales bacterium]